PIPAMLLRPPMHRALRRWRTGLLTVQAIRHRQQRRIKSAITPYHLLLGVISLDTRNTGGLRSTPTIWILQQIQRGVCQPGWVGYADDSTRRPKCSIVFRHP